MSLKVVILIAVVISVIATAGITHLIGFEQEVQTIQTPQPEVVYVEKSFSEILNGTNEIRKISSQKELIDLLQASELFGGYLYGSGDGLREGLEIQRSAVRQSDAVVAESAQTSERESKLHVDSVDHSSTNIQVENVDEPDYLKNDGKYVYVVSKNTLSIIDAYPAEDANLILKVALDVGHQYIQNMFLNGDRLVIFYNGQSDREIIPKYDFIPIQSHDPITHALIIDVSDRKHPSIIKDYSIGGHFMDARMIGDHAYFVTNSYIDHQYPRFPVIMEDSVPIMMPEAFYFDSIGEFSNFNTLTAIDIFGDTVSSETFLMGYTGTFYVSENNFYLTYQQYLPFGFHEDYARDRFFDVIVPLLPANVQDEIKLIQDNSSLSSVQQWSMISEVMQNSYNEMSKEQRSKIFEEIKEAIIEHETKIQEDTRKTIIHKIAIDEGNIKYVANGSVPGRLLNQFSMDEDGDRFRVATTTEIYAQYEGIIRSNAVYILDEELNIVGGLDQIAPDESIFSARFIDDRLYMVTFQQIDPFFVIDLSTDTPKILGELKIPGFSSYLHPYDKEHIIGIGRDTKEIGDNRVQQLGIKIALFNVADVSNPIVADDIIIGDRSTHSEALYNHKSFFFDKIRGVLSIPIAGNVNELDELSDSKAMMAISPDYNRWSGFYVFELDDMTGFDLKGAITHSESDSRYYGMGNARTFYIEDVLYTASESYLKMNSFDNLEEVNTIKLENTGNLIKYMEGKLVR